MEYTQTLKVPPIVCGMWSNTLTTFRHDFDSFSRLDQNIAKRCPTPLPR